jgi:MFS family permease
LIRSEKPKKRAETAGEESVMASVVAGLKYVWADEPLRVMFMVLMAINFLLMGPLMVGIPVLANQRLPEGAAAFGILMSAFSGGNLIGYLLAGSMRRPDGKTMRLIIITMTAAFGVIIGSLGFIPFTWVDFGLLLLLGLGNGYIGIILITWMQARTPKEMLGRLMGLFALAGTGLAPISQALAGALSKWNLTLLFVIPGVLVLLVIVWMAPHPALKTLGASMVLSPAEA